MTDALAGCLGGGPEDDAGSPQGDGIFIVWPGCYLKSFDIHEGCAQCGYVVTPAVCGMDFCSFGNRCGSISDCGFLVCCGYGGKQWRIELGSLVPKRGWSVKMSPAQLDDGKAVVWVEGLAGSYGGSEARCA